MDLSALPLLAAQTMIAAASTDAWTVAKKSVARLFGRGDVDRENAVERRLDQTQRELESATGQARDEITGRLVTAWQVRLADLLEEQPQVAGELETLVEQLQASLPPGSVTARDQSIVAGRDLNLSGTASWLTTGPVHGDVIMGPTNPGPAQD
jgi:hypothetical protein